MLDEWKTYRHFEHAKSGLKTWYFPKHHISWSHRDKITLMFYICPWCLVRKVQAESSEVTGLENDQITYVAFKDCSKRVIQVATVDQRANMGHALHLPPKSRGWISWLPGFGLVATWNSLTLIVAEKLHILIDTTVWYTCYAATSNVQSNFDIEN